MIKQTDRDKALKRKRIWDIFGWGYGEGYLGYLRNNHTLNCGCSCCRAETFMARLRNRQNRYKTKLELKNIC